MKNKKMMFNFAIICSIVFFIFYYIFCVLGNNKNINQEVIVDDILDCFYNYEANINVEVISNKNEHFYEMNQIVENERSKTIINFPENLKNLNLEVTKNKLVVSNTNLNMERIYNNYETVLNNSLFLNTYANDYKNNESKVYEKNDEIICEVTLNKNTNTYAKYKELYLDKKNKSPKKLVIKDNTKKTRICIIYNDITFK